DRDMRAGRPVGREDQRRLLGLRRASADPYEAGRRNPRHPAAHRAPLPPDPRPVSNLPGGPVNCKLWPDFGDGTMLSESENRLMTQVGPGTPGGEMLRRYWWPIEFSAHVRDRPMKVRLLGQEFVLFRNLQSKVGMLDLHCPHRLTSLEFGRVEEQGIRCCY